MAGGAEMGSTKAVVDSNRATVTTFVLEEISAMLWTDLEEKVREREKRRGRGRERERERES